MNFNDWLDEQTKQINTYFTRRAQIKTLIDKLQKHTLIDWKPHDETGGLVGRGDKGDYWLDINKNGYDLGIRFHGDTVQLYGLDLDNLILEVNKNEM